MRKLVILRGAQGCGKSTFIQANNLEVYTLCADKIRLMYSSPEITVNYNETIPQFNNKKIWNLLYEILEDRMQRGEFTIIDAVHANVKESLSNYKKLAEKYRYRLYVLDFTDIPKEIVYERNNARESYKQVPESSIDKSYRLFAKESVPSSFQVIKPENFQDIIKTIPRDFNKYENIHVIGDIHGCLSALKKYFTDNPIKDKDAYIFTGDYFDRGIENYETFNYLLELMKNDNMIFLVGNHEDKLYKYACGDEFKMDYDIKNTIEEFEDNKLEKSLLRGFVKKLAQISFIEFNDQKYLISHGGIPYFPSKSLDLYSTNSFIYGIDKYDVNIDSIYNEYMETQENKVIQIHAHRNYYKIKYDEYPLSLNLEGGIEHGGHLRVLNISPTGISCTEIKNDIYNPNLIEETAVYNLINDFKNNKYIIEKALGNNISSFNFSKEAFANHIWDNMTTKARGLFIDTLNNKIIARSYNKFFKINERRETQIEDLINTLNFPVNFYLKYNGFLGILSTKDGELFFASKSTNEGPFVTYFKDIFYNIFSENQISAIKNKMLADNLSFVFEVIDPINDPHIIEYREPNLILLDMIYNTNEYDKVNYDELKYFSKNNSIEVKELIYTANNPEEFKDIYNQITGDDYQLNGNFIEGFVLEDNKSFMLKTKTAYYEKWKRLRGMMEKSIKNNNYKVKNTGDIEQKFLEFIREKYENKEVDIKDIDIISERKEFEDIK